MNIFYLDKDPETCAQMHLDKHASKMCVEYAQLLSTAHRVIDGTLWYGKTITGRNIARYFLEDGEMNEVIYKACHVNHPSTKWVRKSADNYEWLYALWVNLCKEYSYRYGRIHESFRKLEIFLMLPPRKLQHRGFSEPTPAMKSFPECIVENDSLASYRNYYWVAKRDFAKWTKREKPEWWNERERFEAETIAGTAH